MNCLGLTHRFEKLQPSSSPAEADYEGFSIFLRKLAFQMIQKFKPNVIHRQSSNSCSSSSSSSNSSSNSNTVNPARPCVLVSIIEYMTDKNLKNGKTKYQFGCCESTCRSNSLLTEKLKERARTHYFCHTCSDLDQDHNIFVFSCSPIVSFDKLTDTESHDCFQKHVLAVRESYLALKL